MTFSDLFSDLHSATVLRLSSSVLTSLSRCSASFFLRTPAFSGSADGSVFSCTVLLCWRTSPVCHPAFRPAVPESAGQIVINPRQQV